MTEHLVSPIIELDQQMDKALVSSSRHLDWSGILVEQYQTSLADPNGELPALSDHWLSLPLGQPGHLTQKRDDRLHNPIVKKGDIILVPAGQPSYWHRHEGDCSSLHICLKPELIEQVAEASEINPDRITLINCFGQQDLQLYWVATLLLSELQSDGIMGQLYVESLTQALAIHLLRYYSTVAQTITSENRSLSHTQLQEAIDYIHTHLSIRLPMVTQPLTWSVFLMPIMPLLKNPTCGQKITIHQLRNHIYGFEEQYNVDLMGELVNDWYGSGNWNLPQ